MKLSKCSDYYVTIRCTSTWFANILIYFSKGRWVSKWLFSFISTIIADIKLTATSTEGRHILWNSSRILHGTDVMKDVSSLGFHAFLQLSICKIWRCVCVCIRVGVHARTLHAFVLLVSVWYTRSARMYVCVYVRVCACVRMSSYSVHMFI